MRSPMWLLFDAIVLAWGAQLMVRGIARTRRSRMGRRAAILGRLVPGAVGIAVFGPMLLVLCIASGARAETFWAGTPMLLMLMWGVAGLVGGWLRLRDLERKAMSGEFRL